MSVPERALGEVLQLASVGVSVEPEGDYPIAGIYSFGRGLIRRPTIRGSETSYATLSRLSKGQLTMSKLNAWEGALAVVPEEFEGSYVSPEYPVFNIDRSQADPAYIAHLVRCAWPVGSPDTSRVDGTPEAHDADDSAGNQGPSPRTGRAAPYRRPPRLVNQFYRGTHSHPKPRRQSPLCTNKFPFLSRWHSSITGHVPHPRRGFRFRRSRTRL